MQDLRGHNLSGANVDAIEGFETALKSFQNFFGDAIGTMEATLERSPQFLMGHLLVAIAYYLTSERRHTAAARAALTQAERYAASANPRESRYLTAVTCLINGEWHAACRQFDAILDDWPTDILALQTAHLLDFFRGDALNLRNRPARVLPAWDIGLPGFSYVQGMYAFGLEECNQYPQAEQYGHQALDLDPFDPWSIHALVHVCEMQGRTADGIHLMTERQHHWAPDNGFAYHNWWHLGLLHLEDGDTARALAITDQHIFLEADDAMVLLDTTAMFWRLHLAGIDLGVRWQRLADFWQTKLTTEPGHYAFNDFHAALAFAGAGRIDTLDELQRLMRAAQTSSMNPANRAMQLEVGLPLVEALGDFVRGEFATSRDKLRSVRDGAHIFGGSHAQRDLITLTLLSAAHRSQSSLTQALLNERAMQKPRGQLGHMVAV